MRRKILIILISGLVPAYPAISQNSYNHHYQFEMPAYHVLGSKETIPKNYVDSFALVRGIEKVELKSIYYTSKVKPKFTSYTTGHFDKQGRLTEMTVKDDSGFRQSIAELNQRTFDQRGNMVSSRSYYYGQSNFMELHYNDSNNLVKETYYDKKHIRSSIEKAYNDQNLMSTASYKNKKGRVRKMYSYSYYPDKKLKQVILRNKKGKISAVWDYTCDFSGKEVKKLGDTSKVCTLKSYLPDGTIITTTQSFTSAGVPWKTVVQTDSQGRNVKYEYYRGKTMHLVYVDENIYSGKSVVKSTSSYYKKGKLYWSQTKEYDARGAITADIFKYYKHGKAYKSYKSEYLYDKSGLLVYKKQYLNDRLKYMQNFSYSFYKK